MAQYVYSKSIDFPNGILVAQLTTEIVAVIPTPVLYDISVAGDVVTISFASSIPSVGTLDTVIANHVPVYFDYVSPYLVNDVVTNKINNTEYQYFGNDKFRIIISQNGQSYYSSIATAIAENNTPNQVFVVYPGTYVENNPLVLPPGATIMSAGSTTTTIIVAQNPGSDLLVVNQKCSVSHLSLIGASTVGSRGIYFDATQSGVGAFCIMDEVFITDCDIGVECDGKNSVGAIDTMYANKLVISTQNISTSKGVYSHAKGQFIGTVCYVNGKPATHPVAQAYACIDNGSKLSLITASVKFCTTGLYVDNLGNAEISLLNVQNNNSGVVIGPNGTTTRLSATSLIFGSSTTYDIDIQATAANVGIYSCFLDDAKFHNPNNVIVSMRYNSNKFNSYYQTILGDLQVGSPFNPSMFAAGEGLFINSGILVLSNSNLEGGTWVDNTTVALDANAVPFNLFQGVGTNNVMYFGSDKLLFGFKLNVTTATSSIVSQNDLAWEYWNGVTWTSFTVMQLYPDKLHTYISSFISLVSTFHIRFGLTSNTPFATKTLNGNTKYWVRLRIINSLPSLPQASYVNIHTSAALINTDGYLEHFGGSRIFKNKDIVYYSDPSNPTSSQELFLAPSLSLAKPSNQFIDAITSRIGFNFKMPVEIDISFPLKFNIGFVCDSSTSGNIQWILKCTFTNTNTPIYLNATDASTNPNPNAVTVTKITSIPLNNNKLNLNETISIDCSRIASNPSSSDKYYFYGTLTRNASGSNPSDTYAGSAIIVSFDYDYVVWSSGGYLLGF